MTELEYAEQASMKLHDENGILVSPKVLLKLWANRVLQEALLEELESDVELFGQPR